MKIVTNLATKYGSIRVDFIGETYPDISIKGAEREKRAASTDGSNVFTIVDGNQKLVFKTFSLHDVFSLLKFYQIKSN